MSGVAPPEDATGDVAVTLVTLPEAVELTVWLGHVPVMLTLVPATRLGLDVPVPPLATANVPPKVTAPVVAVEGVSPVEPALKELTPEVDKTTVFRLPVLSRTCQALPCV